MDFEQAAAMAVSYPVAWNLLRHRAGVGAGDTVLVMGAAGGLGIAGVLVARALGARVIAAAGDDARLERVREVLGAEETVNYSRPGWAERIEGVATVFENISDPALFDAALGTLRPYGSLVTCGVHGGGIVPLDVRRLYRGRLSDHRRHGRQRGRHAGGLRGGRGRAPAAASGLPSLRARADRGGTRGGRRAAACSVA